MGYFRQALPPPSPTDEDEPFWCHVRQGRLHFQCCEECKTFSHPPTLHCPACGSSQRIWKPASSRGVLFSYTVVHRASHPSVRDDTPYNVVLVAFPECGDVRLVTNAVGLRAHELRIGMELEVFIDGEGGSAVPRVRCPGELGPSS